MLRLEMVRAEFGYSVIQK